MNGYTVTEQKLLDVLSDGMPHALSALVSVVDEYTEKGTVQVHIFNLRRKLAPHGRDIVCREGKYRMMRVLASADDGKR